MPNYWNPNNFYPMTYSGIPQQTMPVQPMQSMAQQPVTTQKFMEWVEGEVGAKAFQMPAGLPANQPIALWDNSDTVIYLKSWSPMGIPNPIQKLRYEMPEQPSILALQSGNNQSGNMQSGAQNDSYVTKADFDNFKNELRAMMSQNGNNSSGNNGNGGNNTNGGNNQNRGGNR